MVEIRVGKNERERFIYYIAITNEPVECQEQLIAYIMGLDVV